jgi:CBS domain-containing protein
MHRAPSSAPAAGSVAPGEFDFAVAPFDALTAAERLKLAAALDIAYYPEGTRLIRPDERPEHLYIVVKGIVQELAGEELVNLHAARDSFDALALIEERAGNTFLVQEDLVCYLLPKQVLLDLARSNRRFAAYYTDSLADRLTARDSRDATRRMSSFLLARVKDAFLAEPLFVAPETSLRGCAQLMRGRAAHTLLVQDGARVGILSRTDLSDAVFLKDMTPNAPVGAIARYKLLAVDREALLSDAMLRMTRHRVRRLVVTGPGGEIVGILELPALLGYLSNHSHLVSLQVQRAASFAELGVAAAAIAGLVRTLFADGTKLGVLCPLVTELNRSLLARAFALVAPPELATRSCLVVMGSEGRGEQTLRTDQDNALIVADGVAIDAARRVAEAFSERLGELGFPPCPGKMMVSNPAWTRTVSDFRDQIHRWVSLPGDEGYLPLAAFTDSTAVCGDPALLAGLKSYLAQRVRGDDAFLANFARPTLAFETPRFLLPEALLALTDRGDGLDIKKAGLFPVVHGARSMALKHQIDATATVERVATLAEKGILDPRFAADLREAFQFLLSLRLKTELGHAGAPEAPGPRIDLATLTRTDAHLFKDALSVVVRFKDIVASHFKLTLF